MRVIIRAVPARKATVDYLQDRIPEAEVIWDHHGEGCWSTFLPALRMGDGPTVHLEDDITLTRRFMIRVEAALAGHRSEVVQLFSLRAKDDQTIGSRYDRKFMMTQAFYLPEGYGPRLARWIEHPNGGADHRAAHPCGIDTALDLWLRARHERYWLHVPSLVQHNVERSITDPRRSSRRQSPTFTDPDPIGGTVDVHLA